MVLVVVEGSVVQVVLVIVLAVDRVTNLEVVLEKDLAKASEEDNYLKGKNV
jgi:hypothetical protein